MKTIVQTEKAPAAIGPYSQAVKAGGFVFLSGQVALDPASGQVVEGDVRAQTERVMKNLQAVLAAAGSSLAAVVKATVFLADMNDFAAMNEVYGRFFSSDHLDDLLAVSFALRNVFDPYPVALTPALRRDAVFVSSLGRELYG